MTTATHPPRRIEDICPPWCLGHFGIYQGWENLTGGAGQSREHSGAVFSVGDAGAYLNQPENEDHSLQQACIDLYVDHDTASLTPAQVREYAEGLLAMAAQAEARG